MSSSILSARDLEFLLFEWLQVTELTRRERFADHSRETFEAVLDVSEQLATELFAPHNRTADLNEPRFDGERVHIVPEVRPALQAYAEAGLIAGAMDAEVGGIQLPRTVMQACFAWFQAANIGTASYPMLTMANANLLLAHGSKEQVDTFVRPMIEGRFFGTMCLSEPAVGSSLADITTKAVPEGGASGAHRLFGTKMWISGGEHDLAENIVHLVLARTEGAPAGVKGLSLFVVPKYLVEDGGRLGERNDVVLAGLNHKMGYRGTVNTLLNFGEGVHTPGGREGAVGYLVGREGDGLRQMFHMMNEARIGVGAGAAALGYTGYLHALEYARTRTQGRPVGGKDAGRPPVPIIEHADVRRMLLSSKCYAEGSLALVLYAARLLDEQDTGETEQAREEAGLLLDLLTPVVKTWPSVWGLAANDHAIQVHGGYGYTRDYPVEQFYRDNRLNPIHEGTHGIQAADLLGRKVLQAGGAGLELLAARVRATTARAGEEWAAQSKALVAALDRVREVTAALWAGGDPKAALANAWQYLEAFGHVVVAWLWLEQALATGDRQSAFHAGKRAAARYFFTHELPSVHPKLDLLASLDTTLADLDDTWL
jgi:butyryl-CoA dehydrogenase